MTELIPLNIPAIVGHVKWFAPASDTVYPALTLVEWAYGVLIVAIGVYGFQTLEMRPEAREYNRLLDAALRPLRDWVPLIVRLSTSMLLFVNIRHDYLLAPNVPSDRSFMSWAVILLFSSAALMVGIGYVTRLGAVMLLFSYILALAKAPSWVDVADHFEYIGVAGYLWLRGPGRYSLDGYFHISPPTSPELLNRSLDFYRISVGIGLVILSLSEKLMNVTLAQQFLEVHRWNVLSYIGVGDRVFIITAGSLELVIGLALILNLIPRAATAIVLGTMIITAMLLGVEEIYGHIFAVGIVVALWVNDRVHLAQPDKAPIKDRLEDLVDVFLGWDKQPGHNELVDGFADHPASASITGITDDQPTRQLEDLSPKLTEVRYMARGRVLGMLELRFGRDDRIDADLVESLINTPDLADLIRSQPTLDHLFGYLGHDHHPQAPYPKPKTGLEPDHQRLVDRLGAG